MFFQSRGGLVAAAGALFFLTSAPSLAEMPEKLDQRDLNSLAVEDPQRAFIEAFEAGDELTEAAFTTERGAGARVSGDGTLFSRFPRADLKGKGEWATHVPARETGPVAQACIACHSTPYANGARAQSAKRCRGSAAYRRSQTLPAQKHAACVCAWCSSADCRGNDGRAAAARSPIWRARFVLPGRPRPWRCLQRGYPSAA